MSANTPQRWNPDNWRDLFPVCRDRIYLNHAAVCPVSRPARDATVGWLDRLMERGLEGAQEWEETAERGRVLAAELIGCSPHEVAYVRNTSHGLGLVAESLDWAPGDEVAVCRALEYPSNVYVWDHLASRGVRARDIEPNDDVVTASAVEDALTPRTRLVSVSSVQYATGGATELDAIGQLCRDRGVLLCVDAIQSLGVSPLRARDRGIHFASADSHKWMLGVLGIGVFYVHEDWSPRMRPPLVGWKSTTDAWNFDRLHFELRSDAARFEEGSMAYPLIAGLVAAMQMLVDAGVERIESHVSRLLDRLDAGLQPLGARTAPTSARRVGILTAAFDELPAGMTAEDLALRLEAEGIVVSARRNRLRIAPHGYNTEADIDALLGAVARILR